MRFLLVCFPAPFISKINVQISCPFAHQVKEEEILFFKKRRGEKHQIYNVIPSSAGRGKQAILHTDITVCMLNEVMMGQGSGCLFKACKCVAAPAGQPSLQPAPFPSSDHPSAMQGCSHVWNELFQAQPPSVCSGSSLCSESHAPHQSGRTAPISWKAELNHLFCF